MIRSFAPLGVLCLSLALAGAAGAQPAPNSTVMAPDSRPQSPQAKVEPLVRVDVLVTEKGPVLFGVTVNDSDIAQVVSEIAARANLQVVAKPGTSGRIARLSLPPDTADNAISKVCEAAGVVAERRGGIWFIRMPEAQGNAKTGKVPLDVAFRDIETREILNMIGQGFNLKMTIASAIKSKIPFIFLQGFTPREAVDLVAKAADLEVREDGDTLIISPKPKT